ncbi:MAG: transcription termination/antitermination protein NusA [Candidatus Pacebacteria bacterium]|nr:transcription termination/antitermination protein NusA [Candidatus Paceibacterota bacterium]
MIDIKQFMSAIKQIAEEKGIAQESVLDTVEAALAAAYKRDYGKKGQIIKVKLNAETGVMDISQTHYVVEGFDEEGYITGALPEKVTQDRIDIVDMQRQREAGQAITGDQEMTAEGTIRVKFNPEKHMTLEDAKKHQKKIAIGDEVVEVLEAKEDFGRIAAQTAKQVVIQRLREAERGAVMAEYRGKEGTLVSGMVQRREGPLVFVDLGKTNGLLPVAEQMPSDHYRIGQRLRFYIVKVEDSARGPVIVLSRAHQNLVRELFRMEVPEIDGGAVAVMGIAREPGSRTKIAVASTQEGVDPIGSLVGQRGVRVQTVINDLGGEKIDIIQYDEDAAKFIANALSPAKIMQVNLTDMDHKVALAEVADDQFSLAIGKGGQNVRLAAKITGWKIDVRSPKEVASSDIEAPAVDVVETAE